MEQVVERNGRCACLLRSQQASSLTALTRWTRFFANLARPIPHGGALPDLGHPPGNASKPSSDSRTSNTHPF